MKALWNTKYWSQKATNVVLGIVLQETGYPTDARTMLDFTENKVDSRKLKDV